MLIRTVFQSTLVQELNVYSLNQDERAQISAGHTCTTPTGIFKSHPGTYKNDCFCSGLTADGKTNAVSFRHQGVNSQCSIMDNLHSVIVLPNAVHQGVHALVNQVPVGLPQTKALLFEHFGEAQQVCRAHLKVGVIQEDDLQEERLFPQTLQEPHGHLPLRLAQQQQASKRGQQILSILHKVKRKSSFLANGIFRLRLP